MTHIGLQAPESTLPFSAIEGCMAPSPRVRQGRWTSCALVASVALVMGNVLFRLFSSEAKAGVAYAQA